MNAVFALPAEYPTLFLAGLAAGFGICSLTCLPLLGACLLGNSREKGDGLRAALTYSTGRLLSAATAGAFCGYLGHLASEIVKSPLLFILSGIFTLAAGIYLLIHPRPACCDCRRHATTPPLLLGLSGSLIPCLPNAAMLAAASVSGSAIKGMGAALTFTLGVVLSPLLAISGLLGLLGFGIAAKIPRHIAIFSRAAGVAVILLGSKTLLTGMGM